MIVVDRAFTERVVKKRPIASYKGKMGRVVIVAGNDRFGGAAIMSATAAVYAGAGLTTVATNPDNWTALHARLPEAMVTDLQAETLTPLLTNADVIVVGPGLGEDAAAKSVLNLVLKTASKDQALIIDGSAITLCSQDRPQMPNAKIIWTPHAVEWQRMSGLTPSQQDDKENQKAFAKMAGTLVLKGSPTRTYNGKDVFLNTSGSPAMATGGSGDTLTGVIAAFCAQFGTNAQTIAAAVWTHSAAADNLHEYVALPTRVAASLPAFMAELAATQS
ncbi:NAD(P)H-hydrate dehydratase [Lacticaseibacillus pabuli]|uniref:ADP-dependent (S)-NAD(P)H-hydrate dehydratase n=1 Tax=Lacticaseibacillus pabuli TaxID=3025672 RepID=A0ABY7WPA4_9LACO|nr:NAD(P)H-hydrate dehydratase [Lacticaseibacillus sp. KACC 23028]WDF82033.1 NAD(P)H-hydrate dehydratase [Lacticaseibacillus sp. KACC 23028]